jgi:hypothetical protein
MAEGEVKKQVSAVEFAKIVHQASVENTGIDGIVAATGLKRTTVSTKLNGLRKDFGKENVPSFKGKGRKRTDKDAVLAALRGE